MIFLNIQCHPGSEVQADFRASNVTEEVNRLMTSPMDHNLWAEQRDVMLLVIYMRAMNIAVHITYPHT